MKNAIFGLLVFLLVMLTFFSSGLTYTGAFSRLQEQETDVITWKTQAYALPSDYGEASDNLFQRQLRTTIGIAAPREGASLFSVMSSEENSLVPASYRNKYGVFGIQLPDGKGDVDSDGDIDRTDCNLVTYLYSRNIEFKYFSEDYRYDVDPLEFGNRITRYKNLYIAAADVDSDGMITLQDAYNLCAFARGGERRQQSTLMGHDCRKEGSFTCGTDPTVILECQDAGAYGFTQWVAIDCPEGSTCLNDGPTRDNPSVSAHCSYTTIHGGEKKTLLEHWPSGA